MDRMKTLGPPARRRIEIAKPAHAGCGTADHDTRPSAGARALGALASGALALPGLALPARADSPVQETTARGAFSYYKEDNLSPSDFVNTTGTGSRERYSIFAYQFNLLTPLTSRIDASVDVAFETMSGASPWWVEPDPDAATSGQAFLQVMSGATIFDQRFDGQLTVNHYFDRGRASLTGGASSEKDYLSGNLGGSVERNYNDRNTTHSLGLGYSWDTITPTDGATNHGRNLPSYAKNVFNLDTALSQILTRSTLLEVAFAYKRSTGFLSDPYKRYLVGTGTTLPDSRPDTRNQITIAGRLRQHIAPWNASIHLDAAYHWDDWEVNGFSTELAWYQTVFDVVRVIPNFRYYSQSQAYFYGPVFQSSSPVIGTSDYRLSPYGALSYGLRAEADVIDWPSRGVNWFVSASYDRYLSSGDYALQTVNNPNPGLVAYRLYSFQLGGRF